MNIPTTIEIRDSIINFWEQRLSALKGFQIKILQSLAKSVLFILATVFAGILRLVYLYNLWALNQTDPQTADDEKKVPGGTLQKWGDLVKVGPPKTGIAPRYDTNITGINGSALFAGTAYRSANDNLYLLEADIVIAGGVAVGIVKATVPEGRDNTEYSLNPGAELNTVNPFNGIDNPAIVATELTAAVDKEDIEDSYRPRVVSSAFRPGAGGSRVDYKRWPLDGEGVKEAFPYVSIAQPNVMLIYIEATEDIDPDGIPTQAVLDAAEQAAKYDPETGLERKPATDFIITLPISRKIFDIEIVNLLAPDIIDAQDKIIENITNTLKNKKPFIDGGEPVEDKNDIVSRSELLAIAVATVSPLGGSLDDLILKLSTIPIESYRLDDGFLSKAGGIIFV